jgi:hypothetical protein
MIPAPDRRSRRVRAVPLAIVPLLVGLLVLPGCVGHRLHNAEHESYLQPLTAEGHGHIADLAIIEFDDHGSLWKAEQLDDALALIDERNRHSETGILVHVFVHGWKHDASPGDSTLQSFRQRLVAGAAEYRAQGPPHADHVVGIYLGWRGATSTVPIHRNLTFWDRRRTAERLASIDMRETLYKIMAVAERRPESKCLLYGYSMGGVVIGRTMAPSLTTRLLLDGAAGIMMAVDLVVLANPALEGLAVWQFLDFLKRHNARLRLLTEDGGEVDAPGPFMVSLTSEADAATRVLYPLGRNLETMFQAFRDEDGVSQRHLANHAAGHVDLLVSHHATVEGGRVVIEPVEDRWNDTPFWIIRVSEDISTGHGDVSNPMVRELLQQLFLLNRVLDTSRRTVMYIDEVTPGRSAGPISVGTVEDRASP